MRGFHFFLGRGDPHNPTRGFTFVYAYILWLRKRIRLMHVRRRKEKNGYYIHLVLSEHVRLGKDDTSRGIVEGSKH